MHFYVQYVRRHGRMAQACMHLSTCIHAEGHISMCVCVYIYISTHAVNQSNKQPTKQTKQTNKHTNTHRQTQKHSTHTHTRADGRTHVTGMAIFITTETTTMRSCRMLPGCRCMPAWQVDNPASTAKTIENGLLSWVRELCSCGIGAERDDGSARIPEIQSVLI